jgi:hypothetical protein
MVPRRYNSFGHRLHRPTILQRGRLTADRPSSPPNTRARAPKHADGDDRSDRDEYTRVAAARRRLPRATRTARVHKLLRCSRLSQRRSGEYEGVLRGRLELVSPPHEGAVRLPLKTDVQCVTAEPFGEIGDLEPD